MKINISFIKSLHIVKLLKRIKVLLYKKNEKTKLNILKTFPIYVPNSAGTYKNKSLLTVQSINQIPQILFTLANNYNVNRLITIDIYDFLNETSDNQFIIQLKEKLDFNGSDKASTHDYHLFYGTILKNYQAPKNILEIGLGTNNVDVVSNMGKDGKPGASLRAFRDYLINSKIYGADIDKSILFSEERINTYFVDQTNANSFEELSKNLPDYFDLIIDDGLHSPNANILTLNFALSKLNEKGWIVIEDILFETELIWKTIPYLLPLKYSCYLIKTRKCYLFAVQKNSN
jgi:hypothetical protein